MGNLEILEKEKEPKIISLGFGLIWTSWAELFLLEQELSFQSRIVRDRTSNQPPLFS